MNRRKHPITIFRHQKIDRQKYDKVRDDVKAYWEDLLPTLDDPMGTLLDAHCRSVARAARFRDKFQIVKSIVGSASNDSSLSDEDTLAILAGWSCFHVVGREHLCGASCRCEQPTDKEEK